MRVVLDRARVAVPAKVGMPTELAALPRELAATQSTLPWELARVGEVSLSRSMPLKWSSPRATMVNRLRKRRAVRAAPMRLPAVDSDIW